MAENEANSVLNTETDPCAEDLEEALCVLRGSDPENCSYSRGYVKRQAVFACNTCTPSAAEPAGICLACANKCHDGHDIFELYTKRNFRCDCGNDKFGDFKCQLSPDKDKENAQNHYNHNFSGLYCTCNQKYPDAENQDQDEMIQCVICEDWFHSRHLGCPVEDPEDLQEMVCEACMNRAPFLWTYASHFAAPPGIGVRPTEETEVDVVGQGDEEDARECSQHEGKGPSNSVDHKSQQQASDGRTLCKRTHEQMTACLGKALSKTEACRLKELQNLPGQERPRQGAVFWPDSWRSELCTCTNCKRSYVAAEVQFLMDESDTMLSYENKGRAEPFGQHPLMLLTSSLDRVQQLEVIYGFNELKSAIGAFVDQHAAEGKVVTVEDVNQLFEELYAKRRKTNTGYQ